MATIAEIVAEEQENEANWIVRMETVELVRNFHAVTTGDPPATTWVAEDWHKVAIRIFKLDGDEIKEDTEHYLVKDFGKSTEAATKMK